MPGCVEVLHQMAAPTAVVLRGGAEAEVSVRISVKWIERGGWRGRFDEMPALHLNGVTLRADRLMDRRFPPLLGRALR